MIQTNALRFATRPRALLALACACSLALVSVPALSAADSAVLQPLADKAPALPLTATFEKGTNTEGAPFVLKLKNDSKASLKVNGKVLLAVVHHAMDKARALPEQTVEAGQVMTVKDLSADDKVLLSAEGFAPLEIKVPFKL
jgi:hypothetical protein